MVSRLTGLALALVLVLGGSVQAGPLVDGPTMRAADAEPEARADTVFVARMQPVEITARRRSQDAGEQAPETRLAATSARKETVAPRSERAVAQPTGADTRVRASNQQVAQQGGPSQEGRSERGVGIGGFVMNETFSVVGSDFYAAFYGAWSEPEDASLYTVSVREEPSPQFGARLTVEVGDTVIFRTFLRPNNRKIQKAAQRAARRAHIYVKKYHEPREVY